MAGLNELSLVEAAQGLEKKQFSSVDLTRSCLERLHAVDDRVSAFLTVDEEGALASAEDADRIRASGVGVNPLLGIPVGIKDNMLVKGLHATAGSRMLENYTAVYDATVVRKLKGASAVILGKTNMDEFAMGSSTENSAFKKTRNPWDLDMVPGGSSGGSAAAVASNECIYALGSDTGGSIRQPAALCGVVGLKPTYGSVSRYGLIAMASSLDIIGPLTKTVEDARLVFEGIRGKDPKDATTVESSYPISTIQYPHDLNGIKVGVPKEYFVEGTDGATLQVIEKAIQGLKELGAEIVDINLPHTGYGLAIYYLLMPAEVSANLARYDGVRYGYSEARDPNHEIKNLFEMYAQSRSNGFGDEVKRRIMLGTFILSKGYHDKYYKKAVAVQRRVKQDFEEAFLKVDCIISPTSPTPAWEIGERMTDPLSMYLSDIFTVSANIAGIPAISLPVGFAYDLPVGLQLMAPMLREDVLFHVGEAYQAATGGKHRTSSLA